MNAPHVRGYIASATVRGVHYPQRVQNLVVRDFATRRHLQLLLSATEYAMPGCYMILESLLSEATHPDGIVVFSAFMLPHRPERRRSMYERLFAHAMTLYAALENVTVQSAHDVGAFEEMLEVAALLERVPGGGRIDKAAGVAGGPDARFWQVLANSD